LAELRQALSQRQHILNRFILQLTQMRWPAVLTKELLTVQALYQIIRFLCTLLTPVKEAVRQRSTEVKVKKAEDRYIVRVGLNALHRHYVNATALRTFYSTRAAIDQIDQTWLQAECMLARQELGFLEAL